MKKESSMEQIKSLLLKIAEDRCNSDHNEDNPLHKVAKIIIEPLLPDTNLTNQYMNLPKPTQTYQHFVVSNTRLIICTNF